MEEKKNKQPNVLRSDPNFRIKSLEELGQRQNLYDGLVTAFREDGTIPKPMKSVEELNKVREKAPIYYGRGGEKYGATTVLTQEARKTVRVDDDAYIPKELLMELQEEDEREQASVSSSGLNTGYLDSLLEQDFEEENTDAEVVEGLSAAQLRIQQAILGDYEVESVREKKPEAHIPMGRAALIQQQLAAQNQTNSAGVSNRTQPAKTVSGVTLQTTPPSTAAANAPQEPRYLSRLELAKLQSQAGNGNVAAPPTPNSNEAVIRSEHTQITFADVLKTMLMYAVALLIAIVLSVVIVKYVGQKTQVSGNSMNDTLLNADQLIIDKLSYRNHEPQRYDIVVFPENEDSMYVKRIIGLPGETVSISEGYIYIDGQMLGDDIYGNEAITRDNYGRLYESSVTLGADEYFVMGDNRNNSTDSRSYEVGNITKDQIIGKVLFRIWPLKRMGTID